MKNQQFFKNVKPILLYLYGKDINPGTNIIANLELLRNYAEIKQQSGTLVEIGEFIKKNTENNKEVNVILQFHAGVKKGEHVIQLSDSLIPGKELMKTISDNAKAPLNIFSISCHDGHLQDSLQFLPNGSSLITMMRKNKPAMSSTKKNNEYEALFHTIMKNGFSTVKLLEFSHLYQNITENKPIIGLKLNGQCYKIKPTDLVSQILKEKGGKELFLSEEFKQILEIKKLDSHLDKFSKEIAINKDYKSFKMPYNVYQSVVKDIYNQNTIQQQKLVDQFYLKPFNVQATLNNLPAITQEFCATVNSPRDKFFNVVNYNISNSQKLIEKKIKDGQHNEKDTKEILRSFNNLVDSYECFIDLIKKQSTDPSNIISFHQDMKNKNNEIQADIDNNNYQLAVEKMQKHLFYVAIFQCTILVLTKDEQFTYAAVESIKRM